MASALTTRIIQARHVSSLRAVELNVSRFCALLLLALAVTSTSELVRVLLQQLQLI